MSRVLAPHPDTPCAWVSRIETLVARPVPEIMELTYRVHGDLGELALAEPVAAKRASNLWEHTCFEAFVRDPVGEGYCEFNFSPSTEWAAYRFACYRTGMRNAPTNAPKITTRMDQDCYEMRVELPAPRQQNALVALSAVIEGKDGAKSYWALTHPSDKPDFHHPDGFALELA